MSTKKPAPKVKAKKATPKAPAPKVRVAAKVKAGTSKASAADRKAVFVEAYIANGGNATQAAITAGLSAKTASSSGQRMLKDVEVATQIASRAQAVADKYKLTTELAARSIYQEMMFDPAKLYDEQGRLKPITELDEDTRMALASIEVDEVGGGDSPLVTTRKVKWANRYQAREQLMKHLGMFGEDNKQKLTVSLIHLGGRGAGGVQAKG